MANNFEFLKEIDKELFSNIEDAQKLFRDEYFNQCAVQVRVFAEKVAKKILGETSINLTFDDTINCLKDKIKSTREQEFVDDLFFIKKIGNKCAHGEDTSSSEALEIIHRAFEVAINYAQSKDKQGEYLSMQFDDTLLITGKVQKEVTLVDKYIEAAQQAQKEALLNEKQGDFLSKIEKDNDGFEDKSRVKNLKQYKKPAKKPKKEKIKQKVKQAQKNLKQNINKTPKKVTKKQIKQTRAQKRKQKKLIAFIIFYLISLFLLTKIIFSFLF